MSPRECRASAKQEPRFHRKHAGVSPFGLTLEQGKKMSGTDQGKPAGKSGRRKGKGERSKKKVSQQGSTESPAPVRLQSPDQDQPLQPQSDHVESLPDQVESLKVDQPATVDEQIDAVVASSAEPPPAALAQTEPPQVEPVHAEPVQAQPAPVSLQTIANAYRDYTRKSFEEFGSFFEQLSGARSLDKAMSVHTEFVKRAYETSVAESQRICELHNQLAKQTLQPLQGLVGKRPQTPGKS
jgi:hypothetical protein